MKRAPLICIGLALATSLAWTGLALAANVRSGDATRVTSNETIDGTLYIAGTTVLIEGRVQGDVFCGGQQVNITGVVEGDVICAAQKITITGEVQGDVRVAAQQSRIEGAVAGSVSLVGQQVDVSANGSVGRDVSIIAQQALINGTVGRDIEALTETFYMNSSLGRHLDVIGTAVSLGDKAVVAGNFVYTSADAASVSAAARVNGTTEHKIPETPAPAERSYVSSMIISFVSFIVLGAALLFVAPRFVKATTGALQKSPFMTLGAGFAGLVLPPFVGGLLLITTIGAPLAALLILVWLASLMCGIVISAQALGQIIVKKLKWHVFAALLAGLAVLFVAGLIPYAGPLVLFAAVVWGVGAQWYTVVAQRMADSKAVKE